MFPWPQNLSGWALVPDSPLNNPVKSVFAIVMTIIFLELTLKVLRHVNKGVTIFGPKPLPIPFTIDGGHLEVKNDFISTYKSPPFTALLGLSFYFVAHFMIFVFFRAIEFQFTFR